MTAKSSRRVVIINNIKSDKIEQAIFILRGNSNQKPDRFIVREAQEIIDNYIRKIDGKSDIIAAPIPDFPATMGKRRRIGAGLVTLMATAALLSLIFIVKYFAG